MEYEKCRRCKRPLSNPQSRKIGFGKICAGKAGVTGLAPENAEASNGEVLLVPQFKGPHIFDVVLSRDAQGNALTNVPHTVIWHSPTGFEFGYGGSGPADLALNILNAFVPPGVDLEDPTPCFKSECSAFAAKHHQDFKSQFIAGMSKDGGTLNAGLIKAWIYARTSLGYEGVHEDPRA